MTQRVLDAYYSRMEAIEQAKRARQFDRVLELAAEQCSSLGAFVDAWREEELRIFDGRLADNWFRIKSIPALTAICQLAPIRLDRDLLERAAHSLEARPELQRFAVEVDEAFERLAVVGRVYATVAENPGTKQAGLGKQLGVDGAITREIVYWAELDGRIVRQKAGSTYALYPGRT